MKTNDLKQKTRKRLVILFGIVALGLLILVFQLAYYQIFCHDELSKKALKQQTEDSVLSARRGNILDRDGHIIAASATTHTVWARPNSILEDGKTDDEIEENAKQTAEKLAEILDLEYESIYTTLTTPKGIIKIAKNVSEEIAEALISENLYGIDVTEDSKRYYPLKTFASQLIGITTDDNNGLTGLELYYDDILSGTDGRWITSTDNKDNTLIFGNNKYYDAEDGYTIVTTIDSNIQRVVESGIKEYAEKYDPDNIYVIVMDPKTGEILAMAQENGYDLSNPRTSRDGDEEYYETLSESELVDYWNLNWRNSCICDVYEPGSVFKLITTALALDYGVTTPDEEFYCEGIKIIDNWTIHCWNWPQIHKEETLTQAVVNSCNQVMMELVERIGREDYYNGLRTFCITQTTGIDYPGEASNIVYDEKSCGPAELATMSFGQGIAVTPLSMISAVCSLVNEGKLMQPHLVKQILDSEGNVVEDIEPVVRNITVSKETAAQMVDILEAVVEEGGGYAGQIEGYRVGGKTGTSNKTENGVYTDDVWTSFVGVAPLEDPQFVVLVVFDNPNDTSSNETAGRLEQYIMKEILSQRNIAPSK